MDYFTAQRLDSALWQDLTRRGIVDPTRILGALLAWTPEDSAVLRQFLTGKGTSQKLLAMRSRTDETRVWKMLKGDLRITPEVLQAALDLGFSLDLIQVRREETLRNLVRQTNWGESDVAALARMCNEISTKRVARICRVELRMMYRYRNGEITPPIQVVKYLEDWETRMSRLPLDLNDPPRLKPGDCGLET